MVPVETQNDSSRVFEIRGCLRFPAVDQLFFWPTGISRRIASIDATLILKAEKMWRRIVKSEEPLVSPA